MLTLVRICEGETRKLSVQGSQNKEGKISDYDTYTHIFPVSQTQAARATLTWRLFLSHSLPTQPCLRVHASLSYFKYGFSPTYLLP